MTTTSVSIVNDDDFKAIVCSLFEEIALKISLARDALSRVDDADGAELVAHMLGATGWIADRGVALFDGTPTDSVEGWLLCPVLRDRLTKLDDAQRRAA